MEFTKKTDYTLYRNLFRRISVHNKLKHSVLPSLNLHDLDIVRNSDFQVKNLNQNGLEVVFRDYRVFFVGDEPSDLAAALIMKKRAWLKRLKLLEPRCKRDAMRELKCLHDGIDNSISIKLRRYIKHVITDPLPGFEAAQNWLYSGGTISATRDDSGNTTIFTSCGTGMSSISKLDVDAHGKISDDSRFNFKINDPILQVILDPYSSLVCVRQKNNLSILKAGDYGFEMKVKKKVRRSNYFTSAAMSRGKVAIAKNLGSIVLFDVEVNKLTFSAMPMERLANCEVSDSWSQLHWRDENLMVLRKKSVAQIDVRGDVVNWDWKKATENCEDLCNYLESSANDNFCYFATTHNLFQVDKRQRKMVHRWTHMLKSSPLYGQAIINNNEELVILQASEPGQSVAIKNGPGTEQATPHAIPGICDVLRSAQLAGVCLDPDISQRANYTVTGTTLVPNGPAYDQLTQNAAGDIFSRRVELETDADTPADWSSWENFENTAPIRIQPGCSDIIDMTKTFETLTIPSYVPEPKRLASVDWRLGEQIKVDTLHLFKDRMVEPILDAWNIETDLVDDSTDMDAIPQDIKVQEWLLKHLNDDP